MRYVFDPRKNVTDQAKHGVSLDLAEVLFSGSHRVESDDRFAYGETRGVALGLIGLRVFVCVFVDRDGDRRLISLRKATAREVKRYGKRAEQSGP